jgi:hypothetical protein
MTGFLGRLALRGAGLAPQAGLIPLRLRPRSLFETRAAPDLRPIDAVQPAHPSTGPAPETAAGAAREAAAGAAPETAAGTAHEAATGAAHDTAAARAFPRPADSLQEQEWDPRGNEGPRAPVRAAPAQLATTRITNVRARESAKDDDLNFRDTGITGGSAHFVARSDAAEPMPSAPTPPRNDKVFFSGTAEPAAAASPSFVSTAPPRAHAGRAMIEETHRRAPQPREPSASRTQPPGRAPEDAGETSPSASLSIGRIEVEFVQPPAPPPARKAPDRTRGFSAYAAIRRGQPR